MSVQEITCKELVEVVTDYLEDRMPPDRRLLFEESASGIRAAEERRLENIASPGPFFSCIERKSHIFDCRR